MTALLTLAVLPWCALSLAGWQLIVIPQLAWKQWTR